MKRFLWLGLVVFFCVLWSGCGETFRPIIIPNPPTFPNPKANHSVVTISANAPSQGVAEIVPGTAMVVNVSGDTDVSIANLGLAPVHAVQQTATQVLVVNQSVPGSLNESLTKLSFNGSVIMSTATISLPGGSAPNFVAVAPTDTVAYVTLPGASEVGVVSTLSNNLTQTLPVGANPDAAAVTPDKTKLYVANQGDGTISAFNVVDFTARAINGASVINAPLWLTVRTDSQRLYVLNGNGVVSTIDTTSTAGPDTVIDSSISVPGATYMVYDPNKNRLYIPGGGVMEIVDISGSIPQLLSTITIPNVPNLPASGSLPATAVAVAALPDGSQAYVASVPSATQASQASISAVQGTGTTATYSYMWTGGHDLTPGITVAISGIASPNDSFNGTYTITSVSGTSCATQTCTFQATNTTVLTTQTAVTGTAVSVINNLFPQVTVINAVTNTAQSTISMPGFPDATDASSPYYVPVCVTTRFRFNMAAGGDSSRAYFSACDGGAVDIINTATNTYLLDLSAPVGVRPIIPPDPTNPPQNPVFLLAGP